MTDEIDAFQKVLGSQLQSYGSRNAQVPRKLFALLGLEVFSEQNTRSIQKFLLDSMEKALAERGFLKNLYSIGEIDALLFETINFSLEIFKETDEKKINVLRRFRKLYFLMPDKRICYVGGDLRNHGYPVGKPTMLKSKEVLFSFFAEAWIPHRRQDKDESVSQFAFDFICDVFDQDELELDSPKIARRRLSAWDKRDYFEKRCLLTKEEKLLKKIVLERCGSLSADQMRHWATQRKELPRQLQEVFTKQCFKNRWYDLIPELFLENEDAERKTA